MEEEEKKTSILFNSPEEMPMQASFLISIGDRFVKVLKQNLILSL